MSNDSGWAWSRGMERRAEEERIKSRTTLKLVKMTVDGMVKGATVEGYVYPHERWNGFLIPMMTEEQLDAFIKAQEPTLKDWEGKVFFDKYEGYCVHDGGKRQKLHRMRPKTPAGEMLYDMSNQWCWKEA